MTSFADNQPQGPPKRTATHNSEEIDWRKAALKQRTADAGWMNTLQAQQQLYLQQQQVYLERQLLLFQQQQQQKALDTALFYAQHQQQQHMQPMYSPSLSPILPHDFVSSQYTSSPMMNLPTGFSQPPQSKLSGYPSHLTSAAIKDNAYNLLGLNQSVTVSLAFQNLDITLFQCDEDLFNLLSPLTSRGEFQANIMRNKITNQPNGMALASFTDAFDAETIMTTLNGQVYGASPIMISVVPATSNNIAHAILAGKRSMHESFITDRGYAVGSSQPRNTSQLKPAVVSNDMRKLDVGNTPYRAASLLRSRGPFSSGGELHSGPYDPAMVLSKMRRSTVSKHSNANSPTSLSRCSTFVSPSSSVNLSESSKEISPQVSPLGRVSIHERLQSGLRNRVLSSSTSSLMEGVPDWSFSSGAGDVSSSSYHTNRAQTPDNTDTQVNTSLLSPQFQSPALNSDMTAFSPYSTKSVSQFNTFTINL